MRNTFMHTKDRCHVLIVSLVVLSLSACASSSYVKNERDPWQGFNRSMYAFNDTLDSEIVKPAAKGYRAITPDFVETGVRNVFGNLDDVSVGVNNVLQGKLTDAGSDVGRILVNTTIGIGGLFDIASKMGLRKHEEDFGQTLGVWGVPSGPYLVLPFFGPSTLRDSPSIPVDRILLDPLTYVELKTGERVAINALDLVSLRAELLSLEDAVEGISQDQYTLIREAYLDRREFLLNDGQTVVDDDLYEGLE